MKIRHDTPFLSSLLFTIVFARLIPLEWTDAISTPYKHEVLWMEIARLRSEFGRSSLVIILIGLIVVWTGYLKKLRWTWFIMLVIVFGWAFSVYVVHDILAWTFRMPMSDWLSLIANAVRGSGPSHGVAERGILEEILLFLLMVVALFLPVKSFFFARRKGIDQAGEADSRPKELKAAPMV